MGEFSQRIDLTGQRAGRWTVLEFSHINNRRVANWRCRCECGREKIVSGEMLRKRHGSQSCGCLQAEIRVLTHRQHGHAGRTSRHSTPEYRSWCRMIQRCCNPKATQYADYGGRGIAICERWRWSFEAFLADMGLKPSLQHTLERIDNDGDYEPSNCRWATRLEQARNRRLPALGMAAQ